MIFKKFALCVLPFVTVLTSNAWSACLSPPISGEAIAQFKTNPKALLAPDMDARTLEATTRDLSGTDASLAMELVGLAHEATPRLQTAIAAGLAQAAAVCVSTDQNAALQIQQAVASFEDGQFQASFAAVAGDLSTAATEAAAANANGSAGSVVMVNPNAAPRPNVASQGGAISTLVQISTIGLSGSAKNSIGSATAANSVSPTR
ncbi:hypothetical protein [Bradyrhizobium sp. 76]|uniref:hypothetical protein n=1 Tax=Bradyrhizobium sp. 76 TaxID=2782680 RepID=UPI001FFAB36B|nr:hypothetical protein [Bradyrhizobium sp. 76]MCK1404975.1 hypothetical protein [Bradyrhizobium sp. 76]